MQSVENFKPGQFIVVTKDLEHERERIGEDYRVVKNEPINYLGYPYQILGTAGPFLQVFVLKESQGPDVIDLRRYAVIKVNRRYVDLMLNGDVVNTPLGLVGKAPTDLFKEPIEEFLYQCPLCGSKMNERRKPDGMSLICHTCTFEGKMP